MSRADFPSRQYVTRDQKLLFIFAFNLVKSGDHLQATRLQRFLNEAHVIDDDQVKDIKAKGSPAERSIELLSAVYLNCSKRRGVFENFCRVVADKQQAILRDHMPGIEEGKSRHELTFGHIEDDDLKRLYGTLRDRGDPFRPEYSKAIFSPYNPYVTSRQHPNSYKELADVHRVKLEEHPVPSETVNFQVLWFTETENQIKAVLAMLQKHKGLKGDFTLYSDADKRFSYYSIAIDDEKVFIHLVYCSDQKRRSLVYPLAFTYSKFNLDFAILTGRCLLFDKEGSDRMRGDVCIVEKAFDFKSKGDMGQIGVSDDVSRVGDALRMKLELKGEDPPSSGLLLHMSDATEMPRPVASCYAQMIWLTRLHLEILEVEKGKKNKKKSPESDWLQETGYDWDYEVTKRKKANEEKLKKFLPDWEKDGSYRGLLSYCKDSGFWPKLKPNETVVEKAKEEMAINVETELESDVREHPRLHVASFASKQEIEKERENIAGIDSSTYEFYKAVEASRKQLLFASIKAVDGFVGCYSDKCPEPRLQPYCDRLAAVAALDLIERIRQK